MDKTAFDALKYGNVIADAAGNKFVVQTVIRDPATAAVEHVGIVPALDFTAAKEYSLVSSRHSETYLAGRSI